MHWSLLLTAPLSGAENMALDEALLERASASGAAVFRVYSWTEPTLSFGRNQATRGVYDPNVARTRGIGIVRRPTGGRSLLHHREVTYSVTAPADKAGSFRESYARINRLLVDGLARLGVHVDVAAPRERSLPPSAAPCFERPAAGELIIDGRKLVGSAQWRDQGALLQHGSILVEDDQSIVSTLGSAVAASQRAATLLESMGRAPGTDEVAFALFDAVRSIECSTADAIDVDEALDTSRARLLSRYVDDCWTWRR